MFKEYNPNPVGNNVGDCVIRAITKAMDKSWEDTYIDIVVQNPNCCSAPSYGCGCGCGVA